MPTSSPEPDRTEELLADYLRRAHTLMDAGEAVRPTVLCREHPELAEALADALNMAGGLDDLETVRDTDPMVGTVLDGRYRLDCRLGMGAMGVVYRATDVELKRTVAVKMLAKPFPDAAEEQRFTREAEVLAALRHPNVVTVHDRGCSSGARLHYLVMEHLEGVSLADILGALEQRREDGETTDEIEVARELLGAGGLAEATWLRLVFRWAAELASGLREAHARSVFHRDVKPSNVFITTGCRAVLLDFGIATAPGAAGLTATATVLGTPWYMAPEQAMSAQAGADTDVWGLCATVYHLLTGRPPYQGDLHEVLRSLQHEDPPPAGRSAPWLPRDARAILDHGLERSRRRRYPGMPELLADLNAFLAHRPVSVRPLGPAALAWRRIRNAPARSVAVAATAATAALAWAVVSLGNSAGERQRQERIAELHAHLPALIAVEGQPRQRLVASLAPERKASIALLDELLSLAPDDLPARLWRAALYLDAGDHAAASRDLEAIEAQQGSAYFRALADRYRAADRDVAGTVSVDCTGLPPAESAMERYVDAFHELRNRHVAGYAERAESALRLAMRSYLPARDLRLIALLALGDASRDEGVRRARFLEAHEEALVLEGVYGRRTARTRAVMGAALVGLGRYREAIEPLLSSLELRPDRHGPLHNLGVAYRRLGDRAAAEHYLEEAARVRPHFINTVYTLAQLRRDQQHFDDAFALASGIDVPEGDAQGLAWRKLLLLASIRRSEAMAHSLAGRHEAFDTAAREAVRLYRQAAAHGAIPASKRAICLAYVRNLGAIHRERADEAVQSFVATLVDQDTVANPYLIEQLWGLIPARGLDAQSTAQVRAWLLRLALHLAEDDPDFAERIGTHLHRTEADRRRVLGSEKQR